MRKVVLTVKEDHKYQVIQQVVNERKNRCRASIELNLSLRQIDRLITKYRTKGKSSFVHGNTGKKPQNKISTKQINRIIKLYETDYQGFNISHFYEFLLSREGIQVSESTLRRILRTHRVLSPKAHHNTKRQIRKELKLKEQRQALSKRDEKTLQVVEPVEAIKAHPSRARKKFAGELIQMDASVELWFGNTKTYLHAAIDDYSGAIVGAYFDTEETLNAYYQVMAQILTSFGIPYEILTDRRTVFNSNKKADSPTKENPLTQFGYACKSLGTKLSVTSIPQTKGRIERLFETLQSRLLNELKLANTTTIEQANDFLNPFVKEFNQKFALPIKINTSGFDKQLTSSEIDQILITTRERSISSGHTVKLNNQEYQLFESDKLVCLKPRTKVLIVKTLTGKLYATTDADQIFDLHPLADHDLVSPAFEVIIEKPSNMAPKNKKPKASMNHPWRRANYRDYLRTIGYSEKGANHMAYEI